MRTQEMENNKKQISRMMTKAEQAVELIASDHLFVSLAQPDIIIIVQCYALFGSFNLLLARMVIRSIDRSI